MTIKELTYLLEVNKTKSFTVASKNLFVSQGVISQSIKNLEQDLGFIIFDRNRKKLSLTKKGQLVVNEAEKILGIVDDIESINNIDINPPLRIKTLDFTPVKDIFVRFCTKYKKEYNTHFSLKICEFDEIISSVINNQCEIGILIFPQNSSHNKYKYLDNDIFEIITLATKNSYIKLRKNHPALNGKNILKELQNYTYVHFRNDCFYPNKISKNIFIDYDNSIYVNDKKTRHRIIENTDAFSIGMKTTNDGGLHHIKLNNQILEIVCFHKKNIPMSHVLSAFIEMLKNQIEFLL